MLNSLADALSVYHSLEFLAPSLERASAIAITALKNGHRLLACGNGGSACEAQHLVGELMGRYKQNRRPLPAIALNTDAATLSCIGNDYCFEETYSRQVEALARPGDILVVFSTSGQSRNIVRALEAARQIGISSIALLGRDGGPAAALSDCPIVVAHDDTARIQEAHQFLLHCFMDQVEDGLGL